MDNIQRHSLNNHLFVIKAIFSKIGFLTNDESILDLVIKGQERVNDTIDLITSSYCNDELPLIPLIRGEAKKIFDDLSLKHKFSIERNDFKSFSKKQFCEIVINIAKNAIENDADEIEIILAGRCLSFIDNGAGFSKAILESLNDGIQVTSKKDGKGLGMITLREFALEYKLALEITNINNGASITFVC